MSKKKHAPSVAQPPQSERVIWTYWISRDSVAGELSQTCQLWYARPERKREGVHIMWQGTCWLGACHPDDAVRWFKTKPDTDLELIKCEQYPTAGQLAEQAKQ